MDASPLPTLQNGSAQSPDLVSVVASEETLCDRSHPSVNDDSDCSGKSVESACIKSPDPTDVDSPNTDTSSESSDAETSGDEAHACEPSDGNADMDEELYPGSKITRAESILLIMGHSLRHDASKEATESLLQLLRAHLPEKTELPCSKYKFFRHFSSPESAKNRDLYCSNCCNYIGTAEMASTVFCEHCNVHHDISALLKSSSYFFSFNIESQICDILKTAEVVPAQSSPSFDVTDITTGIGYRSIPMGPNDVSLTFNTDGVPLFESSKFGFWPLLAQINELTYKDRVQRLVLAGLWFGPKKPVMNTFLLPFVKSLNVLSSTGMTWEDSHGQKKNMKVFPGPCTVDSVARCEVMGMTQFNGKYGCAWCEHPGDVIAKGNGHCRVYPVSTSSIKLRTNESFQHHAQKARRKQEQVSRGIKATSVLTLLNHFDFPTGFVVDYMHAVCAGFVKATTLLWLNSKRCRSFKLRLHLSELNEKLLSLQPIWEISRLPRSLNDLKHWKCADWRNWLLFYSPIVLAGYVPEKNYRHWVSFVDIMYYLLSDCVALDRLNIMKNEMVKFVKEYQELYGITNMTYNAHLLLHLVDTVKHWGPLWAHSMFGFESMNGKLVKMVKGTRYPEKQIIDKFFLMQALPTLWSNVARENAHTQNLFKAQMKGYELRKRSVQNGTTTFYGKAVRSADGTHFRKMSIGNVAYCTADLDRSRRVNSFVIINGLFGRLRDISVYCSQGHEQCACLKETVLSVQVYIVKHNMLEVFCKDEPYHFVKVESTAEIKRVSLVSVEKCLALASDGDLFICRVNEKFLAEAT